MIYAFVVRICCRDLLLLECMSLISSPFLWSGHSSAALFAWSTGDRKRIKTKGCHSTGTWEWPQIHLRHRTTSSLCSLCTVYDQPCNQQWPCKLPKAEPASSLDRQWTLLLSKFDHNHCLLIISKLLHSHSLVRFSYIFIGPRYTWGPIHGSGCL